MIQAHPETARQALRQVFDPFLQQNIVDLGMVHDVRIEAAGQVAVALILPAPDWPPADQIPGAVRQALLELPGVTGVSVDMLWQPAWTPYRMAAPLKAPLGLPEEEPAALPATAQTPAGGRLRRLARRLLRR